MTLNRERIAAKLLDRLGLALDVQERRSPDGLQVDLQPTDVHQNEGFSVRTTIGWRHVVANLALGKFAKDLLHQMAASAPDQRRAFDALVSSASSLGARTTFLVNGSHVDTSGTAKWPVDWQSVRLEVERTPLLINHEDETQIEDLIVSWGGMATAMTISLLPLEEVALKESPEVLGLPEGAKQTVTVNRYERNSINRLLCIAARGTRCAVCSFDFGAVFGDLGRGFIHVHHVTPVSKLGENYVIKPLEDLVPVCPNCHAMLHRREPPFTVEELRGEMTKTGGVS